jgi:hypothetical protein
VNGSYWTSGVDLSGRGEFEWCSSADKQKISSFWAPGMPATPTSSAGTCVKVSITAGKAQLENAPCNKMMPFICEVHNYSAVYLEGTFFRLYVS